MGCLKWFRWFIR